MKLSICMMVKDEEKNLKRCLDKLKSLVKSGLAELIIVDTGSKDNTEIIVREYTDKVYFHEWNNNFSEMRNKSISYAKGEWIFIIDADERLDDVEKLIKLLKSNKLEKYNTIQLDVKNLHNSDDENKYNLNISPRLFRNDGSFKYVGAVHNQPIFKEPILNLDITLTHFGYVRDDKNLMENKFNRTKELLKTELERDSKNLYYIYQLGVSYDMHNDYKFALNQFRKAYSLLSKKTIKEKKQNSYIFAAYSNSLYINSKFDEAIKVAKETINLNPEYLDMYYIVGLAEKHIGNSGKSFNYFCKYIDLINKYNKLEISKNMSIAMHYLDENSISNAYFEICQYYLKNKKYLEAYESYNNISIVKQKEFLSIDTLLPFEKYSELRGVYNNIDSCKFRNNFLCILEEKIKKLEEIQKIKLYKEFSLNEDLYGYFNKVRLTTNKDEKINLTKKLINEINFNKELIFYCEIFEFVKEDIKLIIDVFKKIEVLNLKSIIKYLVEEKGFKEIFENYVLVNNQETKDIGEDNIFISIANVIMLLHIEKNNNINEKYLNIFKSYINVGISFITEVYRMDKAELIYKNINNNEDRFFTIMYIINKLIKENNKKMAIRYMIEAVNTHKSMVKYIEIYKDEILNLEEKNKSFENYKIKVKENINNLISNSLLEEAQNLIYEYEEIVKEDLEIYSMKAIIFIMGNRIDDAEIILKEGLNIDKNNFDLNYNLAYIYEQKGMYLKALETYETIIINMTECQQRQQIIEYLNKLEDDNKEVIQEQLKERKEIKK